MSVISLVEVCFLGGQVITFSGLMIVYEDCYA